MGLFDGKVVIVTGAGGGLGRAHALAFAREGAKVVVNDLGGSRDGGGGGSDMADRVVAEIRASGGQAVANYASVATAEGGASILATAVEHFGGADILVNNAGILRDKTLVKMDEAMWDLVMQVHTKQLYAVTRPVVLHMIETGRKGRIINTTSLAGLLGNYGQSNYSTAKAGTYGFTRTLALEVKKAGITVNAVAPVAKTRMTEDISQVPDDMVPEQISAMVVYLASDFAAPVTGRTFGVHGQQIFEYVMKTTPGVTKAGADWWTTEEIHQRFADITKEEGAPAPAATKGAGADEVTTLFGMIPKGFKPSAATGWKSVMHWTIAGAPAQTLTIDAGTCTHKEGLEGSATCSVKTDRDTVLGMFAGKIQPQKAFMSGKLSADNIGDMMKMGAAFDFPAIAAAMEAARSASAPAPTTDAVAEAFSVLPQAFRADKAGSWAANIQFVVAGGSNQTLIVEGGAARVAAGLEGTPSCTIKVDKDTVIGMFAGSVDGTKAFMAGKIVADNMGELMKFSQFFKFDPNLVKKAAPAAASAAPPAAPAPPKADFARAIGRRYAADYVVATGEHMAAYAHATNDPNPRYIDTARDGGIVAPPIFPVRLFKDLMFKCVGDSELSLDPLMLVHGEQDMVFHGPIRPFDIVNLRGTLESVAQKGKGCVAAWRMYGFVDGQSRVEARMAVFVRGQMIPGVDVGTTLGQEPVSGAGEPTGEPLARQSMTVAMDQPKRYAAASLDDNPIHLDEAVARSAGHPTVILHGLCTMAFAAKAFVDEVLGGDSTRLRRFAVRFTRPVLPGWTLTTSIWAAGKAASGFDGYQVEVRNQDGVVVAGMGWAEVG